jgi:hypothetical protein
MSAETFLPAASWRNAVRNLLALAFVLALGNVAASQAQQTGSTGSTLGKGTPGVAVGTTGTTYSTPGAQQMPQTPGGSIPMGAATQGTSNLPNDPPNLNNSGMPPTR